jgi:hypothetical protein
MSSVKCMSSCNIMFIEKGQFVISSYFDKQIEIIIVYSNIALESRGFRAQILNDNKVLMPPPSHDCQFQWSFRIFLHN